jgi:predicted ATPase
MSRDLRIAFCGAAGTGKTTLVKWLAEELNLPINPVGSRSVSKSMGFDNPYDVDAAGKRAEFQRELFRQKVEWENNHPTFITDRTVVDNLTYTALHDVNAIDMDMFVGTKSALSRYTHVFFLPLNTFQDLAGDPQRHSGEAYHHLFDAFAGALLWNMSGSPRIDPVVRTLFMTSLEDRKRSILSVLRESA